VVCASQIPICDLPEKVATQPYRVVSLLEMLRFAAEEFWKGSQLLTLLSGEPLYLKHPNFRANAVNAMNQLLEHCYKLHLTVSLKEAEKMLPFFNDPNSAPQHIKDMANRLSSVIHSELDGQMLFFMEPSRVEYFNPLWLAASPVDEFFPQTCNELRSAGRCYSYGEPTACVFHLMRVIDAGLRSVAASLGISYDARNWSGIGQKIQAKMEEKYVGKTDEWKKSEPFYASILTDIQAISRGHRNPVLHEIEKKYTDSEAHYLMTITEAFMSHLADNGIKEVP